MFSLFKSQPVLDEASALWIFEVFAWSLRQFNADVFYQHSILVTPSNKHFPGREDSVQGMAELIFANVQRHAGMSHWSFKVTSQHNTMQLDPPKVVLNGALRGVDLPVTDDAHHIIIPYDRNLVSNPEALIASFAAGLSHYLCSVSNELALPDRSRRGVSGIWCAVLQQRVNPSGTLLRELRTTGQPRQPSIPV